MISHRHKCIFIHIPKCAGTSIKYFLFPSENIHWYDPNYEAVHGWCPERKFFMQHATTTQLLETELITRDQWDTYFKFTFVRNPWDRAVSDYFWLMKDQNIKDTFTNYLNGAGKFYPYLHDEGTNYYRGEHVLPQTKFFNTSGPNQLDFVGRFESFETDMNTVLSHLNVKQPFEVHMNKRKKSKRHYSRMYSDQLRDKVSESYWDDISLLGYSFDDQRTFMDRITSKFN